MTKQWCILRCSNANTIPLLRSLTRAGIEVWSPVEQITRRVPRANVKRVVDTAMLPSYLFASADFIPDLACIASTPQRIHRDFRLFRHNDRFPLIADHTLTPLRLLERKSRARQDVPSIKPGDLVRLSDGAFAGTSGVVESAGKQFALVRLAGFNIPLKIATYHLLQGDSFADKSAAA